MSAQPETELIVSDDIYELDRRAWNLPLPRPRLTIALIVPETEAEDRSGRAPHSNREATPAA